MTRKGAWSTGSLKPWVGNSCGSNWTQFLRLCYWAELNDCHPLQPPLLLLQRSWQRYRQAPVLLAGWALGWMLLWQLMALLPLPIWLQFGASLLCFSWASAGLIDVAQRQSP